MTSGQLQFSLINDEALKCTMQLIDTNISENVNKKDEIQKYLYTMQEWTKKLNLYFNVSK